MCLSFSEIERLVKALPEAERERLLKQLQSQANAPTSEPLSNDAAGAWARFREVGKRLAATSLPGAPSLTQSITDSRR